MLYILVLLWYILHILCHIYIVYEYIPHIMGGEQQRSQQKLAKEKYESSISSNLILSWNWNRKKPKKKKKRVV